ncbi:TraR/DksA family transcriptional regulator [Candidatus Wolfebacteria bacterium]|nr:TraR/DksA family transcriptional regulator [Candidatus Wolfebacteria bacterium]
MNKNELEQLKNRLEKEKQEILKEIKSHKNMPDFGNDVDPDEETEESEEYGNILSVVQTYKERLSDIETALKKISNGKYGACEKCKKEISLKILKIDPESRLCQDCKKKKK